MESKICTSLEQSSQLLNMGIDPHTADMHWHHTNSRSETMKWELKPFHPHFFEGDAVKLYSKIAQVSDKFRQRFLNKQPEQISAEEQFKRLHGKDIPAWSLEALFKILPDTISEGDDYYTFSVMKWCIEYITPGKPAIIHSAKANLIDSAVDLLIRLEGGRKHENKN